MRTSDSVVKCYRTFYNNCVIEDVNNTALKIYTDV